MKRIFTVQHTQSEHHTNGMVGSWTDWNLTDLGKQQADRIAEKLKQELEGIIIGFSAIWGMLWISSKRHIQIFIWINMPTSWKRQESKYQQKPFVWQMCLKWTV